MSAETSNTTFSQVDVISAAEDLTYSYTVVTWYVWIFATE